MATSYFALKRKSNGTQLPSAGVFLIFLCILEYHAYSKCLMDIFMVYRAFQIRRKCHHSKSYYILL